MSATPVHIINELFRLDGAAFQALALETFIFQYEKNRLYHEFCKTLKIVPADVSAIEQIPFLPIQFFKTKQVTAGEFQPEAVFESSGTTGSVSSKHFVKELTVYKQSFFTAFRQFYGNVADYTILGLLPSYQERGASSLVFMVDELIKESGSPLSGFYLHEDAKLYAAISEQEAAGNKTILIGVTYALLDFAEKYPAPLQHTIIMETGGMKGRRKELTRAEVHDSLKQRFSINEVHSEYGMTELLSQAFAKANGLFLTPPWMKVLIRAEDDPFDVKSLPVTGASFIAGALNVIDLANIYSCSFIATDDIAKIFPDGSFEVLGRMDNSDIRGCGLMVV